MKWDRICTALAAGMAALALLEALLSGKAHGPKPFWAEIPAGYGLLGALSCLALVVLAKTLGAHLLQKPEEEEDGA
jgi:hypothetical protein